METTSNNQGPKTNKVMTPNDANFRVPVFNDYKMGFSFMFCTYFWSLIWNMFGTYFGTCLEQFWDIILAVFRYVWVMAWFMFGS